MAQWAPVTMGSEIDRRAFAEGLVQAFRRAGLPVGGFYQVREGDSLLLRRIGGDETVLLAERNDAPTGEATCAYAFDAGALAEGRRWLEEAAQGASGVSVLVIDEVSRFEVGGEGHAGALSYALALADRFTVVPFVRAEHLFGMCERFSPAGEPRAHLDAEQGVPTAEQVQAFVRALVPSAR